MKDLNGKLILKSNKKQIWIIRDELRQEAIKWIKELDFCCNSEGFASEEEIQKWIKMFFDIKEEDLR